jgi:transposase InsO family protein
MTRPSAAAAPASPRRWLAYLTGGLWIWSVCFVVLYAGLSLGCEARWHQQSLFGASRLVVALALAWALHLVLLAALLLHVLRWRGRPAWLRGLGSTLTGVAIVATLWIGWPVLALPPCDGPELRAAPAPLLFTPDTKGAA